MILGKSVVSKFVLLMGLSLAALGGHLSGLQAREPAQGAQIEAAPPVQTPLLDFWWFDDGPYDYLTDAIAARDEWRAADYAGNVITGADGNYWVRVFVDE